MLIIMTNQSFEHLIWYKEDNKKTLFNDYFLDHYFLGFHYGVDYKKMLTLKI